MNGSVYRDATHQNVIVLEMVPGQSWDEISAMFDEEKALAAQTGEPVAVVMDVSRTPDPPSADTLSRSRHLFANQPRNIACWVLLGSNPMGDVMAAVLRAAQIVRMVSARKMDDAYALADREIARVGRSENV